LDPIILTAFRRVDKGNLAVSVIQQMSHGEQYACEGIRVDTIHREPWKVGVKEYAGNIKIEYGFDHFGVKHIEHHHAIHNALTDDAVDFVQPRAFCAERD